MSSMLPKPFWWAVLMWLISCGSIPMTRAPVASVATGSLPAIIRSIFTGEPSVGPLPSMATKPSITVKWGFMTVFMSTMTLLMPLAWYFTLNLSGKKPKHVFHA